jgi:hypothetical protein
VLGRLKGRWRRRRLAASFLIASALVLVAASELRGAHEAVAGPPETLLPNLVADPPDHVELETSETEGGLRERGEAQLLLRFNGYVHNTGPGALDFRGERESASVPMKAFQRLYFPDKTWKQEPSPAELVYVTADGHEHWHLQHTASYSLWNEAKTARVAPAQKVGFCLEDSEHVEPEVGPAKAVYSEGAGRKFCDQHEPEATRLFEGVSAGWRDLYESNLAFQWVDVSNVLPGKYWLREDIDPDGVVKEAGGPKEPAYSTAPVTIPGFDALPQSAETTEGQPKTLTLSATAWEEAGVTLSYTIVSPPEHGTLLPAGGASFTYTPTVSYSGADHFTFSAGDPNSPFPRHPAIATVSLNVIGSQHQPPPHPSVQIAGAPASMIAGTSVQLTAATSNDGSGVNWYASAGSISSGGLYTAPAQPPAGGAVTIVASLADGAAVDTRTIAIVPVSASKPAPAAAQSSVQASKGSGPGSHGRPLPVAVPRATRVGDELVMTTYASQAGRVRLSAFVGTHRLISCLSRTPAYRTFTCRLKLARWVTARTKIAVIASLRAGGHVYSEERPPAAVATMRMRPTIHAKAASAFFCGF